MSEVGLWRTVCASNDLIPEVGVRALVDGRQVALFNVQDKYYAVDAIDPFSNAAVMARGIVGDVDGDVVIASPVYKQHFKLTTGECLEDASVKLGTYSVRENNGEIQLALG